MAPKAVLDGDLYRFGLNKEVAVFIGKHDVSLARGQKAITSIAFSPTVSVSPPSTVALYGIAVFDGFLAGLKSDGLILLSPEQTDRLTVLRSLLSPLNPLVSADLFWTLPEH